VERSAEEARSAVAASVAEEVEPPGHPTLHVVARAAAAVAAVAGRLRALPPWPRAGRCPPALATWRPRDHCGGRGRVLVVVVRDDIL
jgi:hypothetical protein